jgi:toxin-antitoxin system PIN domain toxin
VIAVDTNILVYAHREEAAWHAVAYKHVQSLAEGISPWAIPWPCLHEFLAIVTHPKIFNPPTPLDKALAQVGAWLESPSVVLINEDGTYWKEFSAILKRGDISGARVHDARIAAICLVHQVKELWSADRDFSRFPALGVRNPLV